ncbi:MAG: ThiF family adenylyltransferase [Planctomycetes bacterium]|nr:ThiF family adenylyltransferase [Planctomycetota bacterium]
MPSSAECRGVASATEAITKSKRIVLVGVGNIGTRLAMELPLAGTRHLVLVDPDVVTPRNLACCAALGPEDIGKPKVDVLHRHLLARHPQLDVSRHAVTLDRLGLARLWALRPFVLVGAVDSRRSRLELAETAMFLGVPLVDLAIAQAPDAVHARVQVTWFDTHPVDPLNVWSAEDLALIEEVLPCGAADVGNGHPVAGSVSGMLAAALGVDAVRRLFDGDMSDLGSETRIDLSSRMMAKCQLPRTGLSPLDPALAIREPLVASTAATIGELLDCAGKTLGSGAAVALNRLFSARFACRDCAAIFVDRPGPADEPRTCDTCGRGLVPADPVHALSVDTAQIVAGVPVRALGTAWDLLCAVSADGKRHAWIEYGKEDTQ